MNQCKWCGYRLQSDMDVCPACGASVPRVEGTHPAPSFRAFDAPTQADMPFMETLPGTQPRRASESVPQQNFVDERDVTQSTDYGLHAMQAPAQPPQPPQLPFPENQPFQTPSYFPPQSSPPQTPYSFAQPAQAPQAPQQAQPDYARYPQQAGSSMPPVPSMLPMQTPNQPMPPPKRRGSQLSRGATVLYASLALVAMLGGILLILYSAVIHPAQLHQQGTATAVALVNLQSSQTARANAQASATAIAETNATATTQALATAQAVATATALQNIYTQATNGAPTINDSLAFDNYNWDIGNTTDGGGCSFSGGTYHASVRSKGFFLPCIAHATSFSNFAFQVNMTFTNGNSGGLAFRMNASQQNGYLFNITLNGLYGIFVIKGNQVNTPIASGQSATINTNQNAANLLTIVARGSTIYMYVNKKYVDSVSDGTYSGGQIGVFASDDTVPSNAAFSRAEVWKL